jgi:hypothetical protein
MSLTKEEEEERVVFANNKPISVDYKSAFPAFGYSRPVENG